MNTIFKKLKQLLCKHNFEFVGKNKYINENLWQCRKCGIYYIQYYNLGIGYKMYKFNFKYYL